MKFLFLLPRLHNNQYEGMKALLEHGHEVKVGVLYTLQTERYDLVQPTTLGYSWIFRCWKGLFRTKSTSTLKDRFELRYGFPSLCRLWRLIRASRADVVMIKNIDSVFSLMAMVMARLLKKKIVVNLQIDKHRNQPKSGSVEFVRRWFGAEVITPLLGDPKYPNHNSNLHYIPFTHPLDEMMEDRRGRTGPIRILCVAKFQARKQQTLLLRALSVLGDLDWELRLIGQRGEPEYLQTIQTLIRKQGLDKRVSVEVDLPWEKMRQAFRWADLYILPSAREPAAVSLLEAMSFGLPVICSDENGTRCYIVEGENGSVFHSGDQMDLERAIRLVASNRTQLLRMGDKSQELVREYYTPEKTYKQLMDLVSR